MKTENIYEEIDSTLDQLLKNSRALEEISSDPFFSAEISALQKTQESLLSRLIHLNNYLIEKKSQKKKEEKVIPSIYQKLTEFGALNANLVKEVKKNYSPKKKKLRRVKKPTSCSL